MFRCPGQPWGLHNDQRTFPWGRILSSWSSGYWSYYTFFAFLMSMTMRMRTVIITMNTLITTMITTITTRPWRCCAAPPGRSLSPQFSITPSTVFVHSGFFISSAFSLTYKSFFIKQLNNWYQTLWSALFSIAEHEYQSWIWSTSW